MSKTTTLSELAAIVPRSAYIAIGGFQLNRPPIALLNEMVHAGAADLKVVCAPNPLALDLLVASGAVREAESGFIGFQYEEGFVIVPATRRAVESGELVLADRDVYDTIQSLRAGERPDFALLHVQAADHDGNLRIDDPHADLVLAAASRRVLATAEELVDRIEDPTIPGTSVHRVAVCPGGAAPAGCYGHYSRDAESITDYLVAAEAEDPVDYLRRLRRRSFPRRGKDDLEPRRAQPVVGGAPASADPDGSAAMVSTGSDAAVRLADRLVVLMARQIADGEVVATGLASALAMIAIELARRTHAPELRYLNCVGAVDPRIDSPLPTSVDADLLHGCAETMPLPELFDAARRGEVDVMFFGAAQIDPRGRINLSRIGSEAGPSVQLAGPAGSPSMRSFVRKVVVTIARQSTRNLVEQVDYATSLPSPRNLETTLITDLAVWKLQGGRLEPLTAHAGVSARALADRTGFSLDRIPEGETEEPTAQELAALDGLDKFGMRHRLLAAKAGSKKKKAQHEQLVT